MNEQPHTNGHADAQQFADAIATANIPTLLMVLVQMTGELHWLEEPYRRTPSSASDQSPHGRA
jgi:4-hydroxyacetophenone monooxygenase